MRNKNKFIGKYIVAVFIAGFLSFETTHAQFNDIGAFLRAGADDATKLTQEYLKPFPTGLSTGLNAGWSEEAAPKKTLGFSLQIRPSIAIVPDADQSFDISQINLEKIVVANGQNPVTPTISGKNDEGPLLEIYDDPYSSNPNKVGEFRMPPGAGIAIVPAPIVQANLGIFKNTDLTVRYFPETGIGDFGNIGVFGAAVKHELTQWLPADRILPFNLSIMAGFNTIELNGNLDLPPEGTRNPQDPSLTSNPIPNFNNQRVTTTTNAFVMNALIGKSLPFISVYGGVGYQTGAFDLDIKGDYPVNTNVAGQQYYNVLTDPVSFSIDSDSNMHLLGGFRLKLGFLAFYGEATLANYFTANAGVGLSFR